jgi:hypothetical protein
MKNVKHLIRLSALAIMALSMSFAPSVKADSICGGGLTVSSGCQKGFMHIYCCTDSNVCCDRVNTGQPCSIY